MFNRSSALAALSIAIVFPTHVLAIPSPELVIGSATSIGQLIGLGFATVGGGAVLAKFGIGTGADRKAMRRILIGLVVLFGLIVMSIGLNLWQWQTAKSDRLNHLQATLVRPAVINDPTLKELSFDAQTANALGITTAQAETLLGPATNTVFVDVRETAETMMGTLPGAHHVRFPDVPQNTELFDGKSVVLLCHNGNRSSETCAKLAAMGIDCRFIQGGIEKWLVEGRPFSNHAVRGLEDLRALPDYPNKDQLLDTAQVHSLIDTENPVVVDVRYPGDFSVSHLPDAVNLPLRSTPTPDVRAQIALLPKDRPILAACYDRRGCFMSQVLGFELSRAGFDFRGRYTVPWEYFITPTPKPHVAAFIEEQNRTMWQKGVNALSRLLHWGADRSSFIWVVFALALISRCLVLPISIKSEKDQIKLRQHRDEVEAVKQKFSDDPQRRAIFLKRLYAKLGVTPLRNSLALLFLPLTMVGISAVEQVSADLKPDFGLGANEVLIFAALAALLAGFYLAMSFGKSRRQSLIIAGVGACIVFALATQLTNAGNLYLSFALGLLVVQRVLLDPNFQQRTAMFRVSLGRFYALRRHNGTIPLSASSLHGASGNKTQRLAKMKQAGLPVPDGFVVPHSTISQALSDRAVMQKLVAQTTKIFGDSQFAIRSSAAGEDGNNNSFAGVYDTELNVTKSQFTNAFTNVAKAFSADHTIAYGDGGRANILVQSMVDADFAGVLFTQDPQKPTAMAIEWVKGTADDLVSGRISPQLVRLGRFTGEVLHGDPNLNFAPLFELARKIETLFGAPQDIEWVYKAGSFAIVQSRDITTTANSRSPVILETARLASKFDGRPVDEVVFAKGEMSELLPTPTPLSLDFMHQIWGADGSVARACTELGLTYNPPLVRPHLLTVFGRLYEDCAASSELKIEGNRRFQKWFDTNPFAISSQYRKTDLPSMQKTVSMLNALDLDRLSAEELYEHIGSIFKTFINEIHVPVEKINILAKFSLERAQSECDAIGVALTDVMASHSEITPSGLVNFVAADNVTEKETILRAHFGHRAHFDYELSAPRFRDSPEMMASLIGLSEITPSMVENHVEKRNLTDSCRNAIEIAETYQSLKDVAKHNSLKFLAEIQRALVVLGQKTDLNDLVFYFKYIDFQKSLDDALSLSQVLSESQKHRLELLATETPDMRLSASVLERAGNGSTFKAGGESFSGTLVSGQVPIRGRVVALSAQDAETGSLIQNFKQGDILVCPFIHPHWLPEVLRAGAVITQVGGWLSHMAIVAREHGVVMLVGMQRSSELKSGQHIEIQRDGHVLLLDEVGDQKPTGRRKTA